MPRHSGVEHVIRLLEPNPNLPGPLFAIAQSCKELRDEMLSALPNDSPELTEGLRKLLEAKDCFVRQALLDKEYREKVLEEGKIKPKFKVGDIVDLAVSDGLATGKVTKVAEAGMYEVKTVFGHTSRAEGELTLRVRGADQS